MRMAALAADISVQRATLPSLLGQFELPGPRFQRTQGTAARPGPLGGSPRPSPPVAVRQQQRLVVPPNLLRPLAAGYVVPSQPKRDLGEVSGSPWGPQHSDSSRPCTGKLGKMAAPESDFKVNRMNF